MEIHCGDSGDDNVHRSEIGGERTFKDSGLYDSIACSFHSSLLFLIFPSIDYLEV